ncbi:MAG: PAS domain-containing protein [Nitrosomonadales bacterium]|nr:PAS domain-containing protein [Nitrosomonadales bacterium]
MLSIKAELRRVNWLLIVLAAVFIIVWQAPALRHLQGADLMPLPVHVAAEMFAIVIAMLVFGVTWNAYSSERSTNILVLACGFLLVGLLDFGHMFSFKGMPDLVTPSGPEKAIQFWLAGRFATALVLLVVALRAWQPLEKPRMRYALLAGSLIIAAVVYWLILYHGEKWPDTFIEGQGLTRTKVAAEYVIIAILLVAGALFYRQAKRSHAQALDTVNLAAACLVTVLSELCFVLYSAVSDIFNLLGHVYKVIAYAFIYRAVFMDSVREPFKKLRQAKNELQASQMMLQSIISNAPVAIFWKDRDCRYLGANDVFLRDAGVGDVRDLTGRDDYAFFPAEQAERFQVDDRAVMEAAMPKSNIEEPISTGDGRQAWLLTNKTPLYGNDGEVVGVLGAYTDITEIRHTEQRLELLNTQLRELTVRREEAREDERKRIARDLHDELGQILTALRMDVSMLRIRFGTDNPALVEQVRNILWRVDSTIQVVRDVAAKLRPSVLDMGVVAALEWQVEEFAKRSDIRFKLDIDEGIELDDERATAIFRIMQESLTNVSRHAQARTVSISLGRQISDYVLEVIDDGKGFVSEASGKKTFGLMGIRERALMLGGTVDISSAPGEGTRLTIRIPVEKGEVQ